MRRRRGFLYAARGAWGQGVVAPPSAKERDAADAIVPGDEEGGLHDVILVAVRRVLVVSVDELGLTRRPLRQRRQGRRRGCPWRINVVIRAPKTSADVTGLVIVLVGVIPIPALVTA